MLRVGIKGGRRRVCILSWPRVVVFSVFRWAIAAILVRLFGRVVRRGHLGFFHEGLYSPLPFAHVMGVIHVQFRIRKVALHLLVPRVV